MTDSDWTFYGAQKYILQGDPEYGRLRLAFSSVPLGDTDAEWIVKPGTIKPLVFVAEPLDAEQVSHVTRLIEQGWLIQGRYETWSDFLAAHRGVT